MEEIYSYSGNPIATVSDGCATILNDVEKIPSRAFCDKGGIKSVKIPYGVWEIGPSAFEGCVDLERVYVSGDAKIMEQAFAGCPKLEEVIVSGDAQIAERAFVGCPKLVRAYISNRVKLPESAFDDPSLVTAIYYNGTPRYYYTACGFDKKGTEGVIEVKNLGHFKREGCSIKRYRELLSEASEWIINETYPDTTDRCGSDYEFCYDGTATRSHALEPENCLFRNGELIGFALYEVALLISAPTSHKPIARSGGKFSTIPRTTSYKLFKH